MRDPALIETTGGLWEVAGNILGMQARGPRPEPVPREGPLPLSPAQERLWYLCRHEPQTTYYNVPLTWRVHGALDRAALERALDAMVARHEVLRTTFSDLPAAVVHEPEPFGLQDLEARSYEEALAKAEEIARRPFDLAAGPLRRADLIRIGPAEHLLICVFHQIVFDGGSMRIWSREMAHLYRAFASGAALSLPEMRLQYADFVHWKHRLMQGEVLAAHLEYWRGKMTAPYTPLPLAARARTAAETAPGARVPCRLPAATFEKLTRFAAERQATPFATLVAAIEVYLHAITGNDDVMVFASAADRGDPAIGGLIGLLANVLPIRTDLSGNPPWIEAVRRVRESCLGALAWQALPLADIIEPLPHARGTLFQVMLVYQSATLPVLDVAGVRFVPTGEVDNGAAKFDLLFELTNTRDGIRGHLKYRCDLFDEPAASGIWSGLVEMLDGALAAPETFAPAVRAAGPAGGTSLPQEWAPPRDAVEARVAGWCAEAFGLEQVGITDNFFELGGDSLTAIRLLRRIESLTGLELPMTTLMRTPTVEHLAGILREHGYTGEVKPRHRLERLRRLWSR